MGTNPKCEIVSTEQIPLSNDVIIFETASRTPIVKVPVVLAERRLQIVVEADIPLTPAATEIKRVTKNAFLEQVKLVPVRFSRIGTTDFFEVTRAKLYVSGFIRKNIEYSTSNCNGFLRDRIADVPFFGFTELNGDAAAGGDFFLYPVIGISNSNKAQFLSEGNDLVPRLDKYFLQNLVKYNEQPYGELIGANFYEIDFSPVAVQPERVFRSLREKIVMDLYVKVLQVQQYELTATRIIPVFDEGIVG